MHGRATADPGRYALAYMICQEMGWSWSDLLQTPADFVEEIAERVAARNRWTEEKRKQDKDRGGKR